MSRVAKETARIIKQTQADKEKSSQQENRRFQEDVKKAWAYLKKRYGLAPEWLIENELTLTEGLVVTKLNSPALKDIYLICLAKDGHYRLLEELGQAVTPVISSQLKLETPPDPDPSTLALTYVFSMTDTNGQQLAEMKIKYGIKGFTYGSVAYEDRLAESTKYLGQGNYLTVSLKGFVSPESLVPDNNQGLIALRLSRLIGD